jgi:hypothetical protein
MGMFTSILPQDRDHRSASSCLGRGSTFQSPAAARQRRILRRRTSALLAIYRAAFSTAAPLPAECGSPGRGPDLIDRHLPPLETGLERRIKSRALDPQGIMNPRQADRSSSLMINISTNQVNWRLNKSRRADHSQIDVARAIIDPGGGTAIPPSQMRHVAASRLFRGTVAL